MLDPIKPHPKEKTMEVMSPKQLAAHCLQQNFAPDQAWNLVRRVWAWDADELPWDDAPLSDCETRLTMVAQCIVLSRVTALLAGADRSEDDEEGIELTCQDLGVNPMALGAIAFSHGAWTEERMSQESLILQTARELVQSALQELDMDSSGLLFAVFHTQFEWEGVADAEEAAGLRMNAPRVDDHRAFEYADDLLRSRQ